MRVLELVMMMNGFCVVKSVENCVMRVLMFCRFMCEFSAPGNFVR